MKHTGLRNLLIVSVAILLWMALAACSGGKYHGELLRAESILDSLPDSAREILKAIPRDTIDTREDLALRDLIAAEVQYKLYEDGPTGADTLAAAEETFRTNGDDKRLMRTLFQKAVRQFHAVNYSESLVSALEALEIAEEEENDEYLGKFNEHIATLFNNYSHPSQALRYIEKAIYYYSQAGKPRNVTYLSVDKAIAIGNSGNYAETLRILDSLENESDHSDSVLMEYVYQSKIDALLKEGHTEIAGCTVDSIKKYSTDLLKPDNRFLLCVAVASGDIEQSDSLIKSIKSSQTDWAEDTRIQQSMLKYYESIGESDSALQASRRAFTLLEKGLKRVSSHSLEAVESKYVADLTQRQSERKTSFILYLSISLVLGTALFITLLILLRRKAKQRLDLQVAEISNLISEHKKSLADLLGDRVDFINSLCNKYLIEPSASLKTKTRMFDAMQSEFNRVSGKDNMVLIERYVNETQDSIIEKLDSIPGIKGMYRTVAVYTFYGLSPKAISLLCGISVSNVYADKSRLREAIKQSENEHSDVLLKALK